MTATAETETAQVGFLGLGNMGRPMARRLVSAGVPVTVYNRTTAKCAEFADAGCAVAGSIAEIGRCSVVLTMLGTDDDVAQVYLGDGGLVAGARPGAVLVDCSTISPGTSAQVRERCAAAGVHFLAAPVAGGPPVIASGGLAMAVSGDRAAFDRVADVLRTIAPKLVYVGPGDTSRLVKICHNLLVAATLEVLGELCVLAEAHGVERSDLLAFLRSTAMSSRFIEYKAPLLESLDFTPAFSSRLMQKDLELGLDLAGRTDVAMPVTAQVHDTFRAANESGLAELDAASIYLHLAAPSGRNRAPGRQYGEPAEGR
ncbi:3-hydroxyisobutyrate dehydrogenase [Pseudonocardia thermophila]|uniref:3-hydroxyisobutyrate dehydrogenase n=1 Tax=Pseudonocardia thermophila TaxID=1848 RepID=A0A1M6XLB7_PSETH|nr:NAD(P)-dependent oxidoreductase [Pseudonocardia thermophila]SHL06810.1 3-hydroxyisobutyrate dehydrogenase [Pseudonocardia thermophila]